MHRVEVAGGLVTTIASWRPRVEFSSERTGAPGAAGRGRRWESAGSDRCFSAGRRSLRRLSIVSERAENPATPEGVSAPLEHPDLSESIAPFDGAGLFLHRPARGTARSMAIRPCRLKVARNGAADAAQLALGGSPSFGSKRYSSGWRVSCCYCSIHPVTVCRE